jgi:hypothetical protein
MQRVLMKAAHRTMTKQGWFACEARRSSILPFREKVLFCGLEKIHYGEVVNVLWELIDPFWPQAWLWWQIDVKITAPNFLIAQNV